MLPPGVYVGTEEEVAMLTPDRKRHGVGEVSPVAHRDGCDSKLGRQRHRLLLLKHHRRDVPIPVHDSPGFVPRMALKKHTLNKNNPEI